MALKITRALFILSCGLMGVLWSTYVQAEFFAGTTPLTNNQQTLWRIGGGLVGAFVGTLVIFALRFITQEIYERLFPVIIAITLSMVLGYFLARYIIMVTESEDLLSQVYLTSSMVLIFGFMGISLGLTRASNWESLVSAVKKQKIEFGNPKILDTSVLIDGRIGEVVDAGFIEGTLIVPHFVLTELQHIADSPDVLRRNKGRRGLDILRELKEKKSGPDLEIIEDDPEDVREVDDKLVTLAREFKAKIVTTDYNLNKVASIQGVTVLNLNELANAIKTAALPDEELEVKILKEGKESTQGVGYLEDGTMIVVDGGRPYIGQRVRVVVTSVLQTAAGRMIFTKVSDANGAGARPQTTSA
jgi:uncharacterized protein YacL